MLRPTPGDPWGVEQHHWNTGAEENQQVCTLVELLVVPCTRSLLDAFDPQFESSLFKRFISVFSSLTS